MMDTMKFADADTNTKKLSMICTIREEWLLISEVVRESISIIDGTAGV